MERLGTGPEPGEAQPFDRCLVLVQQAQAFLGGHAPEQVLDPVLDALRGMAGGAHQGFLPARTGPLRIKIESLRL
ncbi:hypothetical protein GCM10009642_54880 [Nocardiopsis metallicus]